MYFFNLIMMRILISEMFNKEIMFRLQLISASSQKNLSFGNAINKQHLH